MRTTIAQAVSRRTVLLALAAGLILGGQAVWSSTDDIGSLVSATVGGTSGSDQSVSAPRDAVDPILVPASVGQFAEVGARSEVGALPAADSFDAIRGLIRQFD